MKSLKIIGDLLKCLLIHHSSFHKLWNNYLGDWGGGGGRQHISGPSTVFQRLISTYPGLTFHLGFFIPLSKILLLITLTILQTASSHHIEEKNYTKFAYEHLWSEIIFHTNSAVILITHLEQLNPGYDFNSTQTGLRHFIHLASKSYPYNPII